MNIGKKANGGPPGITNGGDVSIGDISGQVAIGKNIIQTQNISSIDRKELLDSLLGFQKEIAKLNLPADDLIVVNRDITAAVKEAMKEEPDASRIKSRFEIAIETIKETGDTIEKVSKWEWTEKIIKILGKLGFSMLL